MKKKLLPLAMVAGLAGRMRMISPPQSVIGFEHSLDSVRAAKHNPAYLKDVRGQYNAQVATKLKTYRGR